MGDNEKVDALLMKATCGLQKRHLHRIWYVIYVVVDGRQRYIANMKWGEKENTKQQALSEKFSYPLRL